MTLPPNDAPPRLFDRALRARRRDRAASRFDAVAYLHAAAADGIAERLSPIHRQFADAAVIAAANGVYGAALADRFGLERLRQIEAAPGLAARAAAAVPSADTIVGDIEATSLDALGIAEESLDLAVVGLDLHAANDPVGALVQIRRALRPDGLCLAALFAGETLTELRAALTEAEVEITGGLSPRVAPMADLRDLGGLLQRAGFALPVADADRFDVWYASPLHLMAELRAMGESNVMVERRRTPPPRGLILRAAELYVERHARGDGKVRATFEIATLAGWAPAATQQTALRPGSAKARLADALGVPEQPAGEKAGR